MKYTFIVLSLLILFCSCKTLSTSKVQNLKQDITAALLQQESDWNKGDIPAFMDGYLKSENLTFIGKSGVTRGWQNTLDNYIKGYPNKATMGILSFDIMDLEVLSNDVAYMIGKYTLKRESDEPSGYFNLLWKKVNGRWVIASDHTSG